MFYTIWFNLAKNDSPRVCWVLVVVNGLSVCSTRCTRRRSARIAVSLTISPEPLSISHSLAGSFALAFSFPCDLDSNGENVVMVGGLGSCPVVCLSLSPVGARKSECLLF